MKTRRRWGKVLVVAGMVALVLLVTWPVLPTLLCLYFPDWFYAVPF